MVIFNKFFTIVILLFIFSCSKSEKVSIIQDDNIKEQMIALYNEGYQEFLNGDTLYAAKKFGEAELIFPQSEWAPIAALMSAYVYYSDDYYSDAIFELKRYLKTYPTHKDIDYAYFLLAMCYYENIIDEKRDLKPLLESKKIFQLIIKRFPATDFALDAKFKIDLINDQLAGKEMYLGRHYLKSKKWIPAISRFKYVLENYDKTIYVEEAIHRLVETYFIIGLEEESKKYAKLLGYNYNSSDWYRASYKVFNKDYNFDANKFEIKKNKKKFFKNFSDRFKKIIN